MFCSNCGHEIGPDDLYCQNCGAVISDQIVGTSVTEETKQTAIVRHGRAASVPIYTESKKAPKPSTNNSKAKKLKEGERTTGLFDEEKNTGLNEKRAAQKDSVPARRVRAMVHEGVGKIYRKDEIEGVVIKETSVFRYVISLKEYRESWCSFERLLKDRDRENPQPCGFSGESAALHNPEPGQLDDFPAFKHTSEGWFVPAIGELKTFTITEDFTDADRDAVNKTLLKYGGDPLPAIGEPVFYWSSTESSSDPLSARYVSLLSKTVGERSKYSKMSVRLFVKVRK